MQLLDMNFLKSLRVLAGAFAIGCCSNASAQANIPGTFEVDALGAATYTVPLQVPPGVAGMEPKLALSYSSKSGNGMLGMGWSISGLPSITRCRETLPQDGANRGVTFTATDRFCYAGKRLVLVSGSYGAAGSSYRTEVDSFIKVSALGTAGTGPKYFTIQARDGLTMEFGNSADSAVLAPDQSTVSSWALDKTTDVKGNYLTVAYSQSDVGVAYPTRIDYTGNARQSLATTNAVTFDYSVNRQDTVRGYQGGAQTVMTRLVSAVTTWTNGNQVLKYSPTYVPGVGNRTTMSKLSLCDPTNLCTADTQFGWGSVTGAKTTIAAPSVLPVSTHEATTAGGEWQAFDVNGDGYTDLVHLVTCASTSTPCVYRVWLSGGDGTFTVKEFTEAQDQILPSSSSNFWFITDVDGDGRADFVHAQSGSGVIKVWRNNGDGSFTISSISSSVDTSVNGGFWRSADINGDGLPDLLHFSVAFLSGGQDSIYSWISNGDGTFTVKQFIPSFNGISNGTWQLLDVNGDGMADLVMFFINPNGQNPGDTRVFISKGDGTFNYSRWVNQIDIYPAAGVWQQLDLNGDGLMDLVHMWSGTNGSTGAPTSVAYAWTNKGDGTFDIVTNMSELDPYVNLGAWSQVDLNGDGQVDLVHFPRDLSVGYYWTWTSTGNGNFAVAKVSGQNVDACVPSSDNSTTVCNQFLTGDFLGSGAVGHVRIAQYSSPAYEWFVGASKVNLLTSVNDGVGAQTSWQYSPLTAMATRGSYVREDTGAVSIWNVISSTPVVDTAYKSIGFVSATQDLSSAVATYYSYGSLRTEPRGRGLLGFHWLQATDSETHLANRTVFRQDFPYTGMVASKGVGQGGSWNNLDLTTTAYGCTMLEMAPACTVAPGNRYFVYPAQVTRQLWDLDGTAMPAESVTYENPDNYGNLQTVTNKILTPALADTDYKTVTTTTYWNDPTNWFLGRPLKVVTAHTGPTVASPVVPGSGGLPSAPSPVLPPKLAATVLMPILSLLLDD